VFGLGEVGEFQGIGGTGWVYGTGKVVDGRVKIWDLVREGLHILKSRPFGFLYTLFCA